MAIVQPGEPVDSCILFLQSLQNRTSGHNRHGFLTGRNARRHSRHPTKNVKPATLLPPHPFNGLFPGQPG